MPAADASGEVFSLNADARYEGLVTGRAGAGAQLGVTAEAAACHGLSLEASARAVAEANAAIGFLLAARATGVASASAGVAAKAQLRPDIFDRFGLILEAAAAAEASAGGRLAVGLDFSAIARFAEENLDGLALELFLAFLEEIVLEAGVWGRISAAAMASAHADITVSLADDDDAGIVIEAGAAVGLGAGAGYDLYGAARFDDVRRFYARSVRLVTQEASTQARAALPADLKWAAEIIELALPTALQCVYELGQTAALGSLASADKLVEPVLAAFGQSARTYVVDKAASAAPRLFIPLVERLVDAITHGEVAVDLDEVRRRFEALDSYIDANLEREIELEDIPVLGGFALDLADAVLPDETAAWRDALAVLWTGLSSATALERPIAQASASASAVGLGGTTAPAVAFELPPAPAFVLEAYHQRLGRNLDHVEFRDAVEFLVDALADVFADLLPQAGFVLDDLARRFGLTVGEFVHTAATLTFGGDLTALPAYQKVRALLQDWMDGVLGAEVIPALRQLGADDEYVTDVAAPSLEALSTFVLSKLDEVVGGGIAHSDSAFTDKLSAGCSTLAYGIFIRNALFLERVLFEHTLDGFEDAFRALARAVRSEPAHVLAQTLGSTLATIYPGNPALVNANVDAVAELVATMAEVGADAFGPGIWSNRRRRRLRELKRDAVLGLGEKSAFRDESSAEAFVRELVLCAYVPNQTAVEDLAVLLGEILVDVAGVVFPRGINAWSTFLLRITRPIVEQMDQFVRDALRAIADLVDAALRELDRLARALRNAIDEAEAAARALAAELREIEDILRSNGRRRQIKDALRAAGAAEAERAVRALDGDPDTVAPGEDLAVVATVGAFHLAFSACEPLLDLGLEAAEAVADDVADLIDGAMDAADALERIVEGVIDAALGGIADAASSLGISLPSELSPQDVADAVAEALPTSLLLSLLDAAIAAGERNDRALAAQADAERRKAAAADAAQRRIDEQKALQPTGALRVAIGSPLPPPRNLADAFVYGPEIEVLVRVSGAPAAFFQAGRGRHVRLAVNGLEVAYRPSDWRAGVAGFEYTQPLVFPGQGLRPGWNVFEVSVVDGVDTILRQTVGFVVDPNAPSLRGSIRIDPELSVFDTVGDDHERTRQERVAVRWSGRRTLPIEGWRLRDRGGKHTYVFGRKSLAPGSAIVLRTGGSPRSDRGGSLHWGLRRAVWNNRAGDTVVLIDSQGFVRASFLVAAKGRSR